jgi:hypothetical protein
LPALLLATVAAAREPVTLPGLLTSGAPVPVHLQEDAWIQPVTVEPSGLTVRISATERFDPNNPRWPPYYSGVHRFPQVFLGRGVLLANLPDGSVRPVGYLEEDQHGNWKPALSSHVQVRLVPGGAELVLGD